METGSLPWQFLLQLVLIAFNAIFSCAEIAFISINTVKLEKLSAEGNRRAARLLKLTSNPAKFLATIQVAITLAGFLASAFAAKNFSGRLTAVLVQAGVTFSPEVIGTVSLVLITFVLSFFTIVLGELVPKRIAMHNADKFALALSSLILFIARAFAPVVWLLTKSTNALLRLFGIDPDAEKMIATEEDIRLLVDAGSKRGSIAAGEKDIIHNVFEFNDKTAETVMTHRRDTTLLWLKDDDQRWEQIILETRHGHYPVCGDTVDDIRGVLNARDYLALKDRSRNQVLEKALHPAWFVPNTVGTHVLFGKMKAKRSSIALALDEYGSFDGIITMNDLIEALVGDLGEDADPSIEKTGPDCWRISGSTNLGLASKELGVSFNGAEKNLDTFGGFVFTLLGRLPDDGEQCEIAYPVKGGGKLHITITDVKDHRLESARIRLER
jgi:putative hemolysin